MKNGKKLCLFLLCTLLLTLLIPGLAAAADSDFEITDGVLTKYTGPGGDVVVPEGVTKIGDGVFAWCENLTSVTLPSTLETLGEGLFDHCDQLTSIVDRSGKCLKTVESIVYSADGTKIIAVLATASGEIHIAEGVTKIPAALFNSNGRVISIVVPEGVISIGDYAFSWCKKLASVTLPSTLETLGENVFSGSDQLTSIEDKSGKLLKTMEGIVYRADGTRIEVVLATASGEIRIADGVTEIPDYLFINNSRVTGVVVPEGVIRIGDSAFYNCKNLTSVALPSTLATLGEGVFEACDQLTSIEDKSGKVLKTVDGIVYSADGTKIIVVLKSASGEIRIAEGVTEIPASLFESNSRITGVVVPEGVTIIGDYAFSYCENLASVTLPSTLEMLGENVFNSCPNLSNIEDKSGKFLKIVDGIVYSADGTQIKSVTSASGEIRIAEGVTEIPASLFESNSRITGVVVPEGVTIIGDYAFSYCENLTSVILPSTLVELGEGVFERCNKLTSIVDKSGKFLKVVDGIVYSADGTKIIVVLESASGEIRIAEGITEIPASLFGGNSRITGMVVPEGVTIIGDYAFSGCANLASVTLPSTLKILENSAFQSCGKLISVEIPEGVTSIGDLAFGWCANLTSVTLPSTLKTLGEGAFTSCDNLSSIVDKSGKFIKTEDGIVYSADGTKIIAVLKSASGEIYIAEGMTEIPDYLFVNNSRITGVVVPEGVIRIGDFAFDNCENLISVTLPATLQTLGESVFGSCPQLTSIEDRSGKFIKTVDGIVYSADGTQMIAVLKSASGKIHIAQGVVGIPDWLFYGNSRINDVIVPEGVVSIGAIAFGECENLTSITLPSSLTVIGKGAIPTFTIIRSEPGVFAHTWALENGYTWQSTQQAESKVMKLPAGLKIIRREAFQGSPAECFVLPDGCVEIGERAFADCAKLRQVKIPASVTAIADNAFEGCGEGLVIVTPKGSMAESFAQAHGITVTSDEP